MSDIVIKAEHLSKTYTIGHQAENGRYVALRDVLMQNARHLWHKTKDVVQGKPIILGDTLEEVCALKDVSFHIQRGEAMGIIGRNGAGKSTLLKVLSRITDPSAGRVTIKGRVASLLEVGTGFHPELTGRENIYLNGAILGMTRVEIKRKFDEIVAFAEVERFLDTPVKRYSSGMYVRLAFAVAAHLEPDILLVDEVLAVGDAAFQKKCLNKMGESARAGQTVLFVSHNIQVVKSLCSTGILFNDGRIEMAGPISEVTSKYLKEVLGTPTSSITFQEGPKLRIQFLKAEFKTPAPSYLEEEIVLKFEYIVRERIEDVLLCVDVRTQDDVSVFYSNDDLLKDDRKRKIGRHTVTLGIPSHLLAPGEYTVPFGFWEPGHHPEHFPDTRLAFPREEPISRLSSHGIPWPGLLYLP